jgi:hypothetical protein
MAQIVGPSPVGAIFADVELLDLSIVKRILTDRDQGAVRDVGHPKTVRERVPRLFVENVETFRRRENFTSFQDQ